MTPPPGASDLRSLLGRAAAHGVSAQRGGPTDTAEDALGMVLLALRDCILPRRLTVLRDGVPVAAMLGAGGRLHALEVPGNAGPALGAFAAGRALGSADAGAVADQLRALLPGGDIAIRALPAGADMPEDLGAGGLAVSGIYAALGLAPVGTTPAERRETLLAAAQDVLIARVGPDGQLYRAGTHLADLGGADIPDTLIARLQGWLAPGGPCDGMGRDELMVFAMPDPPLGVGLLVSGRAREALLFEAGAAADLARFWSDLPGMTGAAQG